MGKSRKTVIVDNDVWWGLKKKSFENGMTMTDYLDGVFKDALSHEVPHGQVPGHSHVISEHLKHQAQDLIDGPSETILLTKDQASDISKPGGVVEITDDMILTKAQAKLEAVQAEKKVETAKGPVKANAAMENFFKPQPKSKWKKA